MLRTPDRAARRSRVTSRSHGRATIATERDWQNSSSSGTFPFGCLVDRLVICLGQPFCGRPLFLEFHHIGFEAIEPRLPDRTLVLEPVLRSEKCVRTEAAGAHAAGFLRQDETA